MWVRRRRWVGRSPCYATATSSPSMRRKAVSTRTCRRLSSTHEQRPGKPVHPISHLVICGNMPSRSDRRGTARSRILAGRSRRRVMRTYKVVLVIGLIGLTLGFPPAVSFDGRPSDPAPLPGAPLPGPTLQSRDRAAVAPSLAAPGATIVRPPAAVTRPATPIEALRSGTQALRAGKPDQAVTSLEYAAEQGMPGAMWKLGRMYADGDGVDQNKVRAFEYFRNLTKTHAYEPPDSQESRFVASAFVALGQYYLDGIPDTAVKPDPAVAIDLFRHAASYFGDSDAQYHLGRLYLLGTGTAKDSVQAARWLRLAANKGQRSAQALLGGMLFKGQGVARQPAMGLAWLTLAKEGAGADEAWITETYRSALAQASADERAQATRHVEELVRARSSSK